MADARDPWVEIAFDCLPLRSLGRLDIPLDASDAFRSQSERIKAAINRHGLERTYYLHNAHCVFHFANSDVVGVCRFDFEGVARTDAGDRKCEQVDLEVRLTSDTSGGVPPAVEAWLVEQVRQAVAVDFDRYIAAGQLAMHRAEEDRPQSLTDSVSWRGMDV